MRGLLLPFQFNVSGRRTNRVNREIRQLPDLTGGGSDEIQKAVTRVWLAKIAVESYLWQVRDCGDLTRWISIQQKN